MKQMAVYASIVIFFGVASKAADYSDPLQSPRSSYIPSLPIPLPELPLSPAGFSTPMPQNPPFGMDALMPAYRGQRQDDAAGILPSPIFLATMQQEEASKFQDTKPAGDRVTSPLSLSGTFALSTFPLPSVPLATAMTHHAALFDEYNSQESIMGQVPADMSMLTSVASISADAEESNPIPNTPLASGVQREAQQIKGTGYGKAESVSKTKQKGHKKRDNTKHASATRSARIRQSQEANRLIDATGLLVDDLNALAGTKYSAESRKSGQKIGVARAINLISMNVAKQQQIVNQLKIQKTQKMPRLAASELHMPMPAAAVSSSHEHSAPVPTMIQSALSSFAPTMQRSRMDVSALSMPTVSPALQPLGILSPSGMPTVPLLPHYLTVPGSSEPPLDISAFLAQAALPDRQPSLPASIPSMQQHVMPVHTPVVMSSEQALQFARRILEHSLASPLAPMQIALSPSSATII